MRNRLLAGALCLLLHYAAPALARAAGAAPPVDEPLGAMYSLGLTLWHLGHSAERIRQFHAFLKAAGYVPEKLLPKNRLAPPRASRRILLEPELLTDAQLTGDPAMAPALGKSWFREGDWLASHLGHAGPVVNIPLHLPSAGLYRLWVQYYAHSALINLKIYRAGQERQGPVCQMEDIFDGNGEPVGPAWKDLLVDLDAGDYVIRLAHAVEWWHGIKDYSNRKVDCLYLTDELWAPPPSPEARAALRAAAKPDGIQWTAAPPLAGADRDAWRWWQLRPLSWEDATANPKLFALGRAFWQQLVRELSRKDYDEAKLPNYRVPERQVVFDETWNLVANPVRARRQIAALTADISRAPLGYHYIWHDVGSHIEGLDPDGKYDPKGPRAGYGAWMGGPGHLWASYGQPTGTVATRVPVREPGVYSVWVLSNAVNLSYTAPWYGKASVDGQVQFTYYHKDKIPSLWMKMGEATVKKPGDVTVEFTLDGAEFGTTYRHIYTLFLVDDPKYVPQGSVRPPWTLPMFRERAEKAGAMPKDRVLLWIADDPYRPLSPEPWTEPYSAGDAWPSVPQSGTRRVKTLLMARDCNRAVQVGLHNLTDTPLPLTVAAGPLRGKAGVFPDAVRWRVEAVVPYGSSRQEWTPFFLLRRPGITVPPLNVAGVWLTVDSTGVPPGDYRAEVRFAGPGVPAKTIELRVRVAALRPAPQRPVLVDGWTQSHEGEAYLRDFVAHRINVWPGEMTKAEMQRWGFAQLRLSAPEPANAKDWIAHIKSLGLDYDDYFVAVLDEPGGTTEEVLKPFLDIAKAIRAADPKVRMTFDPGEGAQAATFQILAPYCDLWCPYSLHTAQVSYWGNPEKQKVYQNKPWIWYTTPCYWDKTARDPGIRQVPSQPGGCVGVAFFALNYPWRDQWDTAYEHIGDASTMGAVMSRHGPVATIVWEQIREVTETADLAMMVRERLGVKTFDEVKDPALQKLIRDGSSEELIRWLEAHPETR